MQLAVLDLMKREVHDARLRRIITVTGDCVGRLCGVSRYNDRAVVGVVPAPAVERGVGQTPPAKLLAATHTLEEMREYIGCDTLAFLSVDGIYRAMGERGRDPVRPQFTDHCFTGEYPTLLTDQNAQETSPRQLSLLAEAS